MVGLPRQQRADSGVCFSTSPASASPAPPYFVIASSLRFRLTLAFSVLVSLVLFVGIVSYGVNEQVRAGVTRLQPSDGVDVSGIDLTRSGLEFEGYWNSAGAFIATQVSEMPETLRPKLRGRIQAIDPAARTMTMYGVRLLVTARTEGDPDRSGAETPFDFNRLATGHRAEVSCKIDEATHQWTATKIELRDVKPSDKVKGMVVPGDLDGTPPETVFLDTLQIVLQPVQENGPETAFGRIEHGTRMLRALQKFRAEAHKAVSSQAFSEQTEGMSAALEMDREAAKFEQILTDASSPTASSSAVPSDDIRGHLQGMLGRVPQLQHLVKSMHEHLVAGSHHLALDFLSEEVEPFLDLELIPYVYAYLSRAEEDLGDELHGVLDRTGTTTRVALGTSLVAVLVAGVLGLMVWRSIHVPIQRLHNAAVALGQGRLDTRVEVGGKDELGVLARAFNSMAGQLATTTVSVTSLQTMFDSMAAAVILCDQSGTVSQANAAAERLLGRGRHLQVGQPLRMLCRMVDGETVDQLAAASARSGGSLERAMLRADAMDIPVSLSFAGLRTSDGVLQGYVLVAQDLSQLKAIELQLRGSLGEKELLLREVHHRVKNNMQVISSLLAMQSTAGDPEVLRRLEESQNRIRTIAMIHEQLYQSTELAHIDTRSYLQVLAQHLVQSYGKTSLIELVLDLDQLHLDLDQSLACGLIVNELLTNAFKYAFAEDERGTVTLRLKEQTDGMRVLEVTDNGHGLKPASGPSRRTLGTSLVAKLARQLNGKVTMENNGGVTVRIVFAGRAPATAVTV